MEKVNEVELIDNRLKSLEQRFKALSLLVSLNIVIRIEEIEDYLNINQEGKKE